MKEFKFILIEENNKAYLIRSNLNKKEYRVVGYDKIQNLLKIEAINYKDNKKIYTYNIKDFDENILKKHYPEDFIGI